MCRSSALGLVPKTAYKVGSSQILQHIPDSIATKHNEFGLTGISNSAEAEAVLSFQTPSGGWSKRTDMRIARLSGQQFGSEANYVPTFDNDATSTQLQWLADFYPQATPQLQQHIEQAIERDLVPLLRH